MTQETNESPSIVRSYSAPDARVRLFCFPHAGAGATAFTLWRQLLPAGMELCAVQLPGKEARFRERLPQDAVRLAEQLVSELLPSLRVPFAFFGHSLGSLLAFEVARALRSGRHSGPVHLFVAGQAAPGIPFQLSPLHGVTDDELLSGLEERYGRIPAVLLRDPQLRAYYLRVLRADLRMVETYKYGPQAPLECAISAFGGESDAVVSGDQLRAWSSHTCSSFRLRMFLGDHFFVNKAIEEILRAVREDLSPWFPRL